MVIGQLKISHVAARSQGLPAGGRYKAWLGGLMVAAGLMIGSPAAAMTFQPMVGPEVCRNRPCILATGEIDKQSVQGLKAQAKAMRATPDTLIFLDSTGGLTFEAMALGNEIRKAGFSTTVQKVELANGARSEGICASACAYAFLGGVQRSIGADAKLGVHQIANGADRDPISVSDAQWLASVVALHIDRMGGGIGVLTCALRTPPQQMYWFSERELRKNGLITDATAPRIELTALARNSSSDIR